MKHTSKKPRNGAAIPNVLPALQAMDDLVLLRRRELAHRLGLSPRSVDNLTAKKLIPYIKISPRCVRFSLEAVLRALNRLEIREAGR
jgi:hypothetical protein